jgi:CTP synthase (UTP-ammonia lyase)
VDLTEDVRRKLSLFCNVPLHAVIEERDVQHTIYEVPLVLSEQGWTRSSWCISGWPARKPKSCRGGRWSTPSSIPRAR